MRSLWKLSLGVVALASLAAAAYCCGGPRARIKVPADIDRLVVQGEQIVALVKGGRLITVDVEDAGVKDLGTLGVKLGSLLDARDGKALVAADKRAYLVNLASGKIEREMDCPQTILGLGFVSRERVYLQAGANVHVVETATGKTIHCISMGNQKDEAMALGASGNRLFVAVGGKECGLAVVDLDKGAIAERIAVPELQLSRHLVAATGSHITGDKIHLLCSRFSYGVWTNSLGYVDLKTRKYTGLPLPSRGMQESKLIAGPAGSLYLTGADGTFGYDAAGKLVTTAGKNDLRMLGVWQDRMLASQDSTLRLLRLPIVTAQAK